MKHFLLIYQLADDYLERREAFRSAHLALAWAAQARGELLLGGTLSDPIDSAQLLFTGGDASVAERFAASDPYVRNHVVKTWSVREWLTVVGDGASAPVPRDRDR